MKTTSTKPILVKFLIEPATPIKVLRSGEIKLDHRLAQSGIRASTG